jgi:hypothetical protein
VLKHFVLSFQMLRRNGLQLAKLLPRLSTLLRMPLLRGCAETACNWRRSGYGRAFQRLWNFSIEMLRRFQLLVQSICYFNNSPLFQSLDSI